MGSDRPRTRAGRNIRPDTYGLRPLPHNPEAEKGVLGCMIQSPKAIAEAQERISEKYFHLPAHQQIFAELVDCWRASRPTDLILFTDWLRERQLLDGVGGVSYVTSLYTFVPTSENLPYYLEIVRERYLQRVLYQICSAGAERTIGEPDNFDGILADIRDQIFELDRRPGWSTQRSPRELVDAVMDRLQQPDRALGISTGFAKLDAAIGGFVEGANVVIAGKTSSGKSAFVQLLAEVFSVSRGIPVAIFTFEMSDEQTIQRIVQIRSEVNAAKIARREAELFEMEAFAKAGAEVAGAPLHVISDRLNVAGIRARCMQLKPRVAIIDYLQIIPEKPLNGETRTERFDRMSAEIKQMAMQLNMTTIVLSQLNEKETTYGSSMMTNDADILLVIETSGVVDESKAVQDKEIHVAKQRDGGRPTIYLSFVKAITTFCERK